MTVLAFGLAGILVHILMTRRTILCERLELPFLVAVLTGGHPMLAQQREARVLRVVERDGCPTLGAVAGGAVLARELPFVEVLVAARTALVIEALELPVL